jgi:hypothetical protein
MLLSVSIGSSTRSVASSSSDLLEVPAAPLGGGYWAPANSGIFSMERLFLGSSPRAVRRLPVPPVGAATGASTCSSPPGPALPCWSSGGGKSGSVASASGAGSAGIDPPEADGSGAGSAVAGPAPEDSTRADDSGAEAVVAGFS